MSQSKKSILERYRTLKGKRDEITLSEKVMEITRAGASDFQAICIFCDTRDYCSTCDATDIICVGTDDTDWCIFTDNCDILEDGIIVY